MTFGHLDCTIIRYQWCSTKTREYFRNRTPGQPAGVNTIEYVTIATLGNAQDFGDLTVARKKRFCFSNATRGVFAGGQITRNMYL